VNRKWLISQKPSPYAEVRLFCFPYAGGSAAVYGRWPSLASRRIHVSGVELPGRGIRLQEEAFHSLPPLIRSLADRLVPLLEGPFAFFGHSMGGLVAFELARALRERGAPQPRHLFISAAAAPGTPPSRRSLHASSDAEVLEELRDLGGTPQALLDDKELMAMALPTLRADYSVLGTYEYRESTPLDVPITVFGGRSDEIAPPADLRGWQAHTAAGCRVKIFPGDHFFLHSTAGEILRTVADTVGSSPEPSRSGPSAELSTAPTGWR
jgi:medium-chain acyl-[acyl-carrier-protein] hydrolase